MERHLGGVAAHSRSPRCGLREVRLSFPGNIRREPPQEVLETRHDTLPPATFVVSLELRDISLPLVQELLWHFGNHEIHAVF